VWVVTLTLVNHDDNFPVDATYTLYDDVVLGPPVSLQSGRVLLITNCCLRRMAAEEIAYLLPAEGPGAPWMPSVFSGL